MDRYDELLQRIEENRQLEVNIINNSTVLLTQNRIAVFACCIKGREQEFNKFITGKRMVSSGPLGIMTMGIRNADIIINEAKLYP